ncbi:glycosyltransferase family 2 protein [Phenylobacterium sp.]|uniref:glycosyltransferase family 2 protein n=1 Tax=Phenylobacterium sp. TaxID=1871053 RepID=UPI002810DABF|nr:glycosyltransferase family 2 protein [Phenylobacterium sp.]
MRLQQGTGVAVIVAAKDAAATIERAVASALAQPEAVEVIVVDDGSGDGTAELARRLDDGSGRLKVVSQPQAGPAAARNFGLSLSRAPWVCPLDADDFLKPRRLERLIAQSDGWDIVADDLLVVSEGAEDAAPRPLIGEQLQLPFTLDFRTFVDANISRRGLARREFGFLKPLMRRAFLDEAALSYDPRLRLGEDFILYATALAKGARFKVVDACGYVSVQRPGSLSHNHTVDDLRHLRRASERLAGLAELKPQEAAAARRHCRHIDAKIAFREVLEAKQAGGVLGALAAVAVRAASAPYILRQSLAGGGGA